LRLGGHHVDLTMRKNTETILGWMIFTGLVSHYVFGYFLWDVIGTEKLYSITVYFCGDISGLCLFIIARTRFLKGMGCLAMVLGTYFFYMEFNDPQNWKLEDYKGGCTFLLLIVNLFFVWYYTDKFKKLKS